MGFSVVILAGGTGSRLWPLSRSMYPKQFLSLVDDKTMLQNTIDRVKDVDIDSITIITNAEHRFLASEQSKNLNVPVKIILEPCARNTAAAICLAALNCSEDDVLLVLSADHEIKKQSEFLSSIFNALTLAKSNYLVTFGVVPTSPNTEFGYIQRGDKQKPGFHVKRFVEKPDLVTAQNYIDSGEYFWNSGMFMFKAGKYIQELSKYSKATLDACKLSFDAKEDYYEFIKLDESLFKKCPNISIDYAVMEKTNDALVVPLTSSWSDLGSWASLWDIKDKDINNNFIKGDVITKNTTNSYISSEDKLIATIGVDDLVIISTKDVVMVAHKDKLSSIKDIVSDLKNDNRAEYQFHREVYRPWGKYDSLDMGPSHQVKRITVKPGAKLSTQYHHHRSEHWIVVSGTATVTKGKNTFILEKNNSTYIEIGEVHSLENCEDINLELIEVQTGEYLGEDDIVRVDDIYDRS
jgi:mannose-1-phosphate guanylyltransferase